MYFIPLFYTGCEPQCRRANPIVGKMSIDYPDALFLKVDVDVMKTLAQEFGVRAMPTFKLLKRGEMGEHMTEVVGFDEGKLRRLIEANITKN